MSSDSSHCAAQEPLDHPQHQGWSVVCLCAGWCGVCKGYEADFKNLARRFPELAFYWVDIEDQAEAMGDVDVETFPTLLLAHGHQVHHFGAMLPQAEVLARHIQSLVDSSPVTQAVPTAQTPVPAGQPNSENSENSEVAELWARLQGVLSEAF